MGIKKNIIIVLVVIALIIGFVSFFVVNEGQQALLLRFGKIETTPAGKVKVFDAGPHFKVPFLEQVKKFDVRLQTLDVQSSRLLTAEQKYLLVDYYVKWRINDLALYYTRTEGNSDQAENLLQQKINDVLRAQFGIHTVQEVVSDDREEIMTVLRKQANISAQNLGISVIDVRIKQIDLPKEVSQSVFARMRADREKVAAKHRSNGQAQAEAIKAQADATATVIVSKAKTKAAKLRAAGDHKAANIYAKVYNQDKNFYQFYRSMQAYQTVFNHGQTVFVLDPKSQFFQNFNQIKK